MNRGDQQGTVLILMLLVLALISVLVLAWAQEWRVELKLTGNYQAVHQSRRLAEAGVYYALGKMVAARLANRSYQAQVSATPVNLWQGDQSPHVLQFSQGEAEIRLADEAGKINLNKAPAPVLRDLFTVLGVPEPRLSIMVDSILDWRSKGDRPLPYGAKSAYYLKLSPPYVAKNGKFDTVGELAWVRGFEAYPLLPRLEDLLTVQKESSENAININAAPLEVLETMGFTPQVARRLIAARQAMPFDNLQEIASLVQNPLMGRYLHPAFKTSPFFTITSTGRTRNRGGRYIIKAIVRLDIKQENLWEIVSWYDGFPSS